jgi:GTP-binding protein
MNPVYHQATFINSSPHLKNAPEDKGSEIAFAGRSNAGKSSAINTLTRQNRLARTSKTPGRTQMLNFFAIDDMRRFVDLPGYGFAKVANSTKQQWLELMEIYLTERESLCGLVLVMDIRHPLTDFDRQMVDWCSYRPIRLHILLTKADKLAFGAAKSTLLQVKKELAGLPCQWSAQLFSALKKTGIDEAHAALDRLFNEEESQTNTEDTQK